MWNFFSKVDNRQGPVEQVEERAISSTTIKNTFPVSSKGTQMGITTSYACIRLLAQSVASVPLKHYKSTEEGEDNLNKSALSALLKQPSPNTSYYQWMTSMMTALSAKGNAYSLIIRDQGVPVELLFISPTSVSVYITQDQNLPYYYQLTHMGKSFKVYPEDLLHFRNISEDNINGLTPLALHRITFDAAASISDYNKTFMDNATNISGIITTDKSLNKETVEEIRQNFGKKFGGASSAGQTPVLSNGLSYQQIPVISPLDADYINNRKMSKADIAEIYGVPLGMVTHTETKYSNAEQESLNFQQITLSPYYDMIDQEMSLKLIPNYVNRSQYLMFTPNRFRMTTSAERSEAISLLKNTGIITANEAREEYGYKKLDTGNILGEPETKVGLTKQAPKNTEDTNPIKGTTEGLNNRSEIEDQIQKLKSKLGRMG